MPNNERPRMAGSLGIKRRRVHWVRNGAFSLATACGLDAVADTSLRLSGDAIRTTCPNCRKVKP